MDISELDSEIADTAALHVKSPKGQPKYKDGKPVRIILHGPGTEAFSILENRQTNRALKRMQDNDGKITAPTPEERKKERIEDMVSLTVAFENITAGDLQGPALFRAYYSHPKAFYVLDQAEKFVRDVGNFSTESDNS